jgi:hypothetical protein
VFVSAQSPVIFSTSQTAGTAWTTRTLVPGPVWSNFEDFRRNGTASLETMPINSVGTLRTRSGNFRVVHDGDFQWLVGLASEICRLERGMKLVLQAARVALNHPDREHVKLVVESVSMLAGSPELPVRNGHGPLHPIDEQGDPDDNFDIVTAVINRPRL